MREDVNLEAHDHHAQAQGGDGEDEAEGHGERNPQQKSPNRAGGEQAFVKVDDVRSGFHNAFEHPRTDNSG